MKRNRLFFLALLLSLWIVCFYTLRIDSIQLIGMIPLLLICMMVPPWLIYNFLIRPMTLSKLYLYLSFIACTGITYLFLPSSKKGFYSQFLSWLLPVAEVALILVVLFSLTKTVIHVRKNHTQYDFLELAQTTLESRVGNGLVLEAILTELRVFYYAIMGWDRQPNQVESKTSFSYHRTSQIKTIIIFFSILILLEGLFFHYLIHQWSAVAAWIFTILNSYALFYLIGLYHSVRLLPHTLDAQKLVIRFGFQSSVELDLYKIDSIQPASHKGGLGEKIPRDTYYSLLTIDSPHYELALKEPALMKGAYGRKKYVSSVIFRSDHSTQMINEIHSNRKARIHLKSD